MFEAHQIWYYRIVTGSWPVPLPVDDFSIFHFWKFHQYKSSGRAAYFDGTAPLHHTVFALPMFIIVQLLSFTFWSNNTDFIPAFHIKPSRRLSICVFLCLRKKKSEWLLCYFSCHRDNWDGTWTALDNETRRLRFVCVCAFGFFYGPQNNKLNICLEITMN